MLRVALHDTQGRAAALAALALLLGGCELKDRGDNEVQGKALFVEHCGACHALERAGTAGTVGPDLDAAFRRARRDGVGESTVEGIVEAQIEHPGRDSRMPAGLVTGEDAENVAAYVAKVAAVPGEDTGKLADAGVPEGGPPGRRVFVSSGCGSCHRLADARANGTTGPDLDEVLDDASAREIRSAIVDPDADLAAGFRAGVMPGDYRQRLSPQELSELVEYLDETAG
jgi:mono/diheme cytochrome c family protein